MMRFCKPNDVFHFPLVQSLVQPLVQPLVQSLASIVPVMLVALLCLGAACVRVQPYQRETLSKRSMTSDKAAGESRFDRHARGSREGSDGGTGEAGGGCGCN